MVMERQDALAALDALEPALRAAANNVLRHAYGPAGMPWGTRMDQAEDLAVRVADRLAQLILHLGLEQQAHQPPPDSLRLCPGCGQSTQDQPPQQRQLRTCAGAIAWPQPAAFCTRCRRAFSPPGPEPGT
jgi:hypothetical protein